MQSKPSPVMPIEASPEVSWIEQIMRHEPSGTEITITVIGGAILIIVAGLVIANRREIWRRTRRAMRWCRFKGGRRLAKMLAFGNMLMVVVTILLATMIVGISRLPKNEEGEADWSTSGWYSALWTQAVILPIIFTALMKLLDRVRIAGSREGLRRTRMRRRRNTEGRLLDGIHEFYRDPNKHTVHNLQAIREKLLRGAVNNVMEVIDAEHEDNVFATLMVFDSDNKEIMIAVARSMDTRNVGSCYAVKDLVAGRAIKNAEVAIENDVTTTSGKLKRMSKTRDYRSIIAWPIMKLDSKICYGALSIDSTMPFAFNSSKVDLESILMPYLTSLACTFKETAPNRECNYAYASI